MMILFHIWHVYGVDKFRISKGKRGGKKLLAMDDNGRRENKVLWRVNNPPAPRWKGFG
jgi:hypothetical protein